MDNCDRIPKIIHYCWFGRKEKPDLIKQCMSTWEAHLTGYQFKEWNEDNFHIQNIPYAQEAYASGKYAFVSDYVRVYALYHYGGIYLDTDVEVFKTFDDLLHHDSFWGFEQGNYVATSTIGAKAQNPLIGQFLNIYESRNFQKDDGTYDSLTNVAVITEMMQQLGFKADGTYQEVDGIGACYPQEYFSPYDYINCRNLQTTNTYSLHHFYKSWLPYQTRLKSSMKKTLATFIGGENIYRLRKILKF